jgi:putative transport protein
VLPIFLGILLGTVVGSIPVALPGLPSGIKLGVAGGPLLVSILLSRLHHFGGMVWYMHPGANLILREVGISLFLACVGIKAGGHFLEAVTSGAGLYWLLAGACITFLPLLVAGLIGRIFLKCNYASMCGLLAGSMTDPPALAFAGQMLGSDAPASVYATVYPLVMILRILAGQLMVLLLYSP